jgi:hypothetical protein
VPNDAPDWSTVIATPAIDLGAFTVPANNLNTVYNGPVPAGTHALKVFIKSTDVRGNANVVTVIDPSDAHTIQQFNLPKSTNLVTAVDDVTTPNIRVDVQALSGSASTGRVVAFLSDQAVSIDNDPNTAVPVTLGGVPVLPSSAQTTAQGSAANAAVTITLPAVANQRIFLSTITASFQPTPANTVAINVTDSITGQIWAVYCGVRGQHFVFPMPMFSAVGANLAILLNPAGAGVLGVIGATWGYGPA